MEFKLTLVVALSLLVAFTEAAAPKKASLESDKTTVDVGGSFVLTCKKDPTETVTDANLGWGFKTGSPLAKITSGGSNIISGATLTVTATTAAAATPYACYGIDTTGPTDGADSDTKNIEVKAIVAPKLTVAPSITDVAADTEVTFTCAKDAANGAPKEYRFFKGTTDITGTDKTAMTLKVKIAQADHDKEFHCQFYNSDTAKADSTKLKATIKGGAAGGSGSEGIHVASLTTICLALVLSAIWKN